MARSKPTARLHHTQSSAKLIKTPHGAHKLVRKPTPPRSSFGSRSPLEVANFNKMLENEEPLQQQQRRQQRQPQTQKLMFSPDTSMQLKGVVEQQNHEHQNQNQSLQLPPALSPSPSPKRKRSGPTPNVVQVLSVFNCSLMIETQGGIEAEKCVAPNLLNRFEAPGAIITSCAFDEIRVYENNDMRDSTPDELGQIAHANPTIMFTGEDSNQSRTYHATNPDEGFTVDELFEKIAEFERFNRQQGGNDWFGGIDTHHVFFEGISKCGNNTYCMNWGS